MFSRAVFQKILFLAYLVIIFNCFISDSRNTDTDSGFPILVENPTPFNEYAIINGTVIDVIQKTILEGVDVYIQNGIIVNIGTDINIPDSIPVFDVSGKFIIPGLMNLHSHTQLENDFFLNIANGVTTVRHMWGNERILELREKFSVNSYLGPNLYVASAGFEQPPNYWPGANLILSKDEIGPLVQEQIEMGYDFIKVYENISQENYLELVRVSRNLGIELIGHIPPSVSLSTLLNNNYQLSIEHIDSYLEFVATDGSNIRSAVSYSFNEQKLNEISKATANSNVWNSPTLTITTRNKSQENQLSANPYLRFVSPQMRAWYKGPGTGLTSWDSESYMVQKNKLVKKLHDSGAKLILGVDTGLRYLIPGLSVHEELENFVKAGIPEIGALQIATINGAKHLKIDKLYGSISIGKKADLVILNANPLKNISNTREIYAVTRGRFWLDSDYLQNKLHNISLEYQ